MTQESRDISLVEALHIAALVAILYTVAITALISIQRGRLRKRLYLLCVKRQELMLGSGVSTLTVEPTGSSSMKSMMQISQETERGTTNDHTDDTD